MKKIRPDERIRAAAAFVRDGAVFADIGTDHGYLPLFLSKCGRISRAICTDINEHPLANARAHIGDGGGCPFVFVHTPGLDGLSDMGITDIAICGMGGELIVQILDAAPFVRDPDIRLILQPMTKQELVRTYLAQHGFCLRQEAYSLAESKYYVTFCAHYDGISRSITPQEALLGMADQQEKTPAFLGYLEGKRRALQTAVLGKVRGGIDAAEERMLIRALETYTKEG